MLLSAVVDSFFFFFKQKTAYEMRISDWSSDVCSSDLLLAGTQLREQFVVVLERFCDITRMHQPAAIEHDRSVADVAQQAGAVTGQHHDLAAAQSALHPLLGLAHEISITGTHPLVHNDDVMQHRRKDTSSEPHLLPSGQRPQKEGQPPP